MSQRTRLSVVVPLYFEEECVVAFTEAVAAALVTLDVDYEVVFVDDGSCDRTVELVRECISRFPALRLVVFSYNHGKQAAITAGLAHSRGDFVVCMDPDLQDPPEEISRFLAKAREGWDLVLGVRTGKRDSWLNRQASRIFWWSLERFTGLDLPRSLSTMRIMSRRFVDEFLNYREANRFLEGMLLHVGLRRTQIVVEHRPRFAGTSKFTLRRKVDLAVNAISDFSDLPLRIATRAGLFLTLAGFLAVLLVVVLKLTVIDFQAGWPSLIATLVSGFGLTFLFLGIIGRYLGNVYREVKRRPLYSIRETVNFPESGCG